MTIYIYYFSIDYDPVNRGKYLTTTKYSHVKRLRHALIRACDYIRKNHITPNIFDFNETLYMCNEEDWNNHAILKDKNGNNLVKDNDNYKESLFMAISLWEYSFNVNDIKKWKRIFCQEADEEKMLRENCSLNENGQINITIQNEFIFLKRCVRINPHVNEKGIPNPGFVYSELTEKMYPYIDYWIGRDV